MKTLQRKRYLRPGLRRREKLAKVTEDGRIQVTDGIGER